MPAVQPVTLPPQHSRVGDAINCHIAIDGKAEILPGKLIRHDIGVDDPQIVIQIVHGVLRNPCAHWEFASKAN